MINKIRKPATSTILAILFLLAVLMVTVVSGCTNAAGTGENKEVGSPGVSRGEHEREGDSEGGAENDEESGTEFALNETYDEVRNGARLILSYDAPTNSFNGTVENTTDKTLSRVRVEVHLSNGIELGPTNPIDLAAGEKIDVNLIASDLAFDGWTAHPEVGGGEGGGEHSGESGEHDGESGEHDGEGSGEHDGG